MQALGLNMGFWNGVSLCFGVLGKIISTPSTFAVRLSAVRHELRHEKALASNVYMWLVLVPPACVQCALRTFGGGSKHFHNALVGNYCWDNLEAGWYHHCLASYKWLMATCLLQLCNENGQLWVFRECFCDGHAMGCAVLALILYVWRSTMHVWGELTIQT
jgi:hypothetical protein